MEGEPSTSDPIWLIFTDMRSLGEINTGSLIITFSVITVFSILIPEQGAGAQDPLTLLPQSHKWH